MHLVLEGSRFLNEYDVWENRQRDARIRQRNGKERRRGREMKNISENMKEY